MKPRRKKQQPPPAPTPDAAPEAVPGAREVRRKRELIQRSRENPHEFFTFEECGVILGFGERSMGRLNAAGAPVAFRKMNPAMICRWIEEHPQLFATE
jgi:hypothetical protein